MLPEAFFFVFKVFLPAQDAEIMAERPFDHCLYISGYSQLFQGMADGKAVFQQDSLSFNEFIVGCDLSHIEEFGFGNLVIFGSYTQPHPLPGRPQQLSVLFGSHQALVQWKPPTLAIGASEFPVPRLEAGLVRRRGKLNRLGMATQL